MVAFRRDMEVVALAGFLLLSAYVPAARAELDIKQASASVYYGAAPESETDYRRLQHLGIKTILDLRGGRASHIGCEQSQAAAHGMLSRHVALGFRPTRNGTPEAALRVLTDSNLQPVYVHCHHGRDRTGLVIALYRADYLGWSREAAYAEFQGQRFNGRLFDLDRYFWRFAR